MNPLDFMLGSLLFGSFVSGFWKGFTRAFIGLATAVAAFLLGAWLHGSVAVSLAPFVSSPWLAKLLGFLAVFLSITLLGGWLANLVQNVFRAVGLTWLDRVLGGAFGLLRGGFVGVALVTALLSFSTPVTTRFFTGSMLAPRLVETARVLTAMAPRQLRDGFDSGYRRVLQLWQEAWEEQGTRGFPG